MKIFPKAFDNNNMQTNMQTLASLVHQHGLSIGADNMMQKGLAALPDTPRLGAGHVAATPLAFAAPVPQVAALGDVSPVVSSQDSQVESPCMSQSPTKKPRLPADTPQSFLDAAKQWYAPGPADPAMPTAASLTCPTEPAPLPPTPLQKASSKPKLLTVVKKTIVAKPAKLPPRPTNAKFPTFEWGPFKIYNGGARAAYRVSSAPGSRDTKLFKSWADVCNHMVHT